MMKYRAPVDFTLLIKCISSSYTNISHFTKYTLTPYLKKEKKALNTKDQCLFFQEFSKKYYLISLSRAAFPERSRI